MSLRTSLTIICIGLMLWFTSCFLAHNRVDYYWVADLAGVGLIVGGIWALRE